MHLRTSVRKKMGSFNLVAFFGFTSSTYNNIGLVYSAQGDYATALEWYRKSYQILKNKLGDTHPSTKLVFANMEIAYNASGFPEDFIDWLQRENLHACQNALFIL